MLAILSPAKKLSDAPKKFGGNTTPLLDVQAQELVMIMQEKSAKDIAELMGLSEKLAMLNYQRYQHYGQKPSQALFTFQGDVYQGLDADSLSKEALTNANKHIAILSGLYGVLRPTDTMQPYRLEMGTKLPNAKGKHLYDFWGEAVSHALNDLVQENDYIVNLASVEYSKVVDIKALQKPMIEVQFKENKDGVYKTIGLFAKKARGKMARYIVQHKATKPSQLIDFTEDGYSYNPNLSNEKLLVFTR